MANQRAKHKRNVTVTMEDELRLAVEAYARQHGLDRTAAINKMCRMVLGMSKAPTKPKKKK